MSYHICACFWAERENSSLYIVMIFVKWEVIAVIQKTDFENASLISRCDSWSHIIQCSLSCQISSIERSAASWFFLYQNEQLQSVSESCSENKFANSLFWALWYVCYTWKNYSLEFICYFVFQHDFEIFVTLYCFCLFLKSASLENLQLLLKQSESCLEYSKYLI